MFLSVVTIAQDAQFSQFYSAPQYLNPGFTGLTAEHRIVANYRNQWPGVKRAYQTYMVSYDNNLSDVNSGIGITIMQDRASFAGLSHTQAVLNYAYRFTVKKFNEIRAGIGFSYNYKNVNYGKLTFNDQLITGSATSVETNNYQPKQFIGINAGALYNSPKIWLGVTGKHLNQPNTSMTGQLERLPLFVGVHGGYRYVIESKGTNSSILTKYVAFSFNYRHQLKNDQLDLGFYYCQLPLTVGVWYRGIPFKKYKNFSNNESLAILVGFEVPNKHLKIGYSFDLTISSLGVNNTFGAHEISLVYEIADKAKYKSRKVLVTVPKF